MRLHSYCAFTHSVTKAVRQYQSEMGETGAGITHEEEIDMSLTNALTNKWGESLLAG